MERGNTLNFVIVGHIDHGKSTLIGRLLHDTNSLPPDRIAEMTKISAELGRDVEFAYLLDHLAEERKQGITIDTTQVFFKTPKRHYVIIDAPGHVEFVKNMVTGAAQAEAAVLIVDAAEGVKQQTKRHSYMLSLLGLKQVIVAVNKMDLVGYQESRFNEIRENVSSWLDSIHIQPMMYLPIAAVKGDNIARQADTMPWYKGPTFLASLDQLVNKKPANQKSLIFPIQDVYKIDDKRINAGRIESGRLEANQQIKILPSGLTTRVQSIEKFLQTPTNAEAGECIGITTEDAVFLERGNVVCTEANQPLLTDTIKANLFWMSRKDLNKNDRYLLRCATQEISCKVENIDQRMDSSSLEILERDASVIKNLEVARVTIRTKKPVCVKDFNDVEELGRFVLVQEDNICGGGIITLSA